MGTIEHIAKWNKESCTWEEPGLLDMGHSFSISHYETVLNDPFDGMNYIIVAGGSRLERNTSNYSKINDRIYRMDNVINHYKNQNGNYNIQCFFIDKDAPIIESAKKFAEYIDSIASLPNTKTISVMGVSKCGTMCFYTPRFFKCDESFDKVNIFNVAAPYLGTKFASPTLIVPEIYDYAIKTLGNNQMGNFLYNRLLAAYKDGCSYSHMDYDISLQDGIGDEFIDSYDREFIRQMFCSENVDAIREIHSFKNFTTRADEKSLPEALATFNFWGVSLCLLNNIFFGGKADGLVPYDSQKSIDDVMHMESIHLVSSHHDVNTNIRVCNEILAEIDKTIGPTLRLKK